MLFILVILVIDLTYEWCPTTDILSCLHVFCSDFCLLEISWIFIHYSLRDSSKSPHKSWLSPARISLLGMRHRCLTMMLCAVIPQWPENCTSSPSFLPLSDKLAWEGQQSGGLHGDEMIRSEWFQAIWIIQVVSFNRVAVYDCCGIIQ